MYLKDQKARFNLQAGTPLAHVIPMSDKDVEIRPQLLNELDFEVIRKRSGFIASFYGNHRRLRKIGNA
jgi:hypothetical protein